MEWLSNHANALNVVANFLILLIWAFYAQLLYSGFRHQMRPRLLINRGRSRGTDALCLISNMSSEAIYISRIIAVLHTEKGELTRDVIEHGTPGKAGENVPLSESTRQGPLGSGDFMQIGTFYHIIRRIASAYYIEMNGNRPTGDTQFLALEIRIVAVYGGEDSPIGAYRVFRFIDEEGRLVPESFDTKRLSRWWWGRRRLFKWIRNQQSV